MTGLDVSFRDTGGLGGRKAGGGRLSPLIHPGEHVFWPKPRGRGRALNGCREGREWVTDWEKGESLKPSDPTLVTVKATHTAKLCSWSQGVGSEGGQRGAFARKMS